MYDKNGDIEKFDQQKCLLIPEKSPASQCGGSHNISDFELMDL
jgi:hypothetical protein